MKINISTKLFVVLFLLLLCFPSLAFADSFCDGFEKGYKTGYMQAKKSSLPPLTPLCPLQPLKSFGDPDSDFEHGYTIGFQKGLVEGSG